MVSCTWEGYWQVGGINYSGADDDYWNAWGCDEDKWNGWYSEEVGNYYLGNVTMLLERETTTQSDTTTTQFTTTQSDTTTTRLNTPNNCKHIHKPIVEDVDMTKFMRRQRDALRGTALAAPVPLKNSFIALQGNDDDSDDDEDTADGEDEKNKVYKIQKKQKTVRKRRWTSKSELENGGRRRVAFHSPDFDDCTTEDSCKADRCGSNAASRAVDEVKQEMSRARVRFATPLACPIPETCSGDANGDTIDDTQQCTYNYNNHYSTTYLNQDNDPTNDHVGARPTLSARAQTPALSPSGGSPPLGPNPAHRPVM